MFFEEGGDGESGMALEVVDAHLKHSKRTRLRDRRSGERYEEMEKGGSWEM